jgi:hypothetical protein
MRKISIFVFLLWNLFLSAGCASVKITQSTPIQATHQSELATKTPQVTQILESINWNMEILQNDKIVPINNGQVELERKPFTIRVTLPVFLVELPTLLVVKLNVFDKDTNFQQIVSGFTFDYDCDTVFCPTSCMAEDNTSTFLFVDVQSTHCWYYDDEKFNRWSRVSIKDDGAILDHDIAFLGKNSISETTYSSLYMVFWIDYREQQVVDDSEIKKVVLMFR